MSDVQTITLDYDLFTLPTAQHKAGLAGLILLVDTMRDREMSPLPEIEIGQTVCSVTWTKESMQAVFNEWYAPTTVEIGKEGEKTTQLRPRGDFLKRLLSDGANAWLKLWQDMVWGVLRTQDKARKAYKDCEAGKDSPIAEGIWNDLVKTEMKKNKSAPNVKLAGALYVGAQAVNAEDVPFVGTPAETLLLHFWQLASLVFCPQRIEPREGKRSLAGYLLVIPEPCDLESFQDEIKDLYQRLDPAVAGFRPRDAIIDVPAEGGLEFLFQLARGRLQDKAIKYSLSAVEIFHLEKSGNNVRMLAAERIVPKQGLIDSYENVRKQILNPIFKTLRLQNLLQENVWHEGGQTLFTQYPWEFFIQCERTPRTLWFFGLDAKKTFNDFKPKEGLPMNERNQDEHLTKCIQRVVRTYVRRKTEDKLGIKFDKIPKNDKGFPDYPKPYSDAVEKVCSDAFLAMRSRRKQDFIEYFTSALCAVPQWLPEEDFLLVTQALLNDPDRVKTISMMALSAASYIPKSTSETEEGAQS
jgi:CRISPR-associated protein Cmx8